MDRFEEMRVFAAVVEAGGFARAAQRLGISRPAVSKHVMQLEARLGVRLLHRTTRRLSVTSSGQVFFERTTKLLSELRDVENQAKESKIPTGRLRVVTPVNFGLTRLGAAVTAFLQTYPQLRLEIELSDRLVDPVEFGYDLAVRIGDPTVVQHHALTSRPLTSSKRILCAAPSYLAKAGVPKRPQDLAHHKCLSYSYIEQPDHWQLADRRKQQAVKVSGPIITSSGQILNAAVVNGLGIAYGPQTFFGEGLKSGAIVRVLDRYELPEVSIYMVFPRTHLSSINVTAFSDFMADYFQKHRDEA